MPSAGGSSGDPPADTADDCDGVDWWDASDPAADAAEDPVPARTGNAQDALDLGGPGRRLPRGDCGPDMRDSYVKSSNRRRGISIDDGGSLRESEVLAYFFDMVAVEKDMFGSDRVLQMPLSLFPCRFSFPRSFLTSGVRLGAQAAVMPIPGSTVLQMAKLAVSPGRDRKNQHLFVL